MSFGSFFFEPFQLHFEPSDLLVELALQGFLLPLLTSRLRTEDARAVLEHEVHPFDWTLFKVF